MLWYLNRYSYLIFSALALAVAAVVGARAGRAGLALPVGVGAVLFGVQRALSGRSSLADWDAVQSSIAGRPSLLFVYSDT